MYCICGQSRFSGLCWQVVNLHMWCGVWVEPAGCPLAKERSAKLAALSLGHGHESFRGVDNVASARVLIPSRGVVMAMVWWVGRCIGVVVIVMLFYGLVIVSCAPAGASPLCGPGGNELQAFGGRENFVIVPFLFLVRVMV